MKPVEALAACPDDLLRRRSGPNQQLTTATTLAAWLLAQGCRPSLFEIEAERAKRDATVGTP
jgi:hypothetical protein